MVARRFGALVLFLAAGLAASASSPGGWSIPTLEELAKEAGLIGIFDVELQHYDFADMPPDETTGNVYRGYFTFVAFRLVEPIKGESPSTLILRFPGGLLPDGRVNVTMGTPIFELGERVFLFVDAERDSTLSPLLRAEWSKFSIESDPSDGTEYVANAWGRKVTGVDPATGRVATIPGPANKEGTTVYIGKGHVGPRKAPGSDESAWDAPDIGPEPPEAASSAPLTPQAFKALIEKLLQEP